MEDLIRFILAPFEFIWFLIKAQYEVIVSNGFFNGVLGVILLSVFYYFCWCFIKMLIYGYKYFSKKEDDDHYTPQKWW